MSRNMRRMRRMRASESIRRLVAENSLRTDDLIAPIFVCDDPKEISSMPGISQVNPNKVADTVTQLDALGINAVILFGVPTTRDSVGSDAYSSTGIVQRATNEIKSRLGDSMLVIADLCLDEYVEHGHCGVLDSQGRVDNDATLEVYSRIALSQAQAGVDMVAPSGMMDGQVRAIRNVLDANSFGSVSIMAYSAKYSSALYGPFRDAVDVHLAGDRKTYQQDPSNVREAIEEVLYDVREGADIIMIKPAGHYLDVISRVRERINNPICAYQVSGEYSMIKAASAKGWIEEDQVVFETLLSIKRAGADMIITYFAPFVARQLRG